MMICFQIYVPWTGQRSYSKSMKKRSDIPGMDGQAGGGYRESPLTKSLDSEAMNL